MMIEESKRHIGQQENKKEEMINIYMEKQKTDWAIVERKRRDKRTKDALVQKRTEGMMSDVGNEETKKCARNSWTEDKN